MGRRRLYAEREEREDVRARLATVADRRDEPADEEADAPERVASAVGNQGFTMLAREGAGILPGGRAHPDVEAAVAAARGRGSPLDARTRDWAAPRLGDDLGDVRVHDDAASARLARAVGARAFTVGRDVFFGEGEHRPGTSDGDELMGHELVHAVQQRGAAEAGPLTVSQPGDDVEREAGVAAPRALHRRPKNATETITFGEDETDVIEGSVHVLEPSSDSVKDEIKSQVGVIVDTLRMTQRALLDAINQFGRDQAFASSEEGEADFDGTFLEWAKDAILGKLVDEVGERLPYFKPVYELTFGLIEKLKAEDERAAKARGSRAVAEFLGKQTQVIGDGFDAQIARRLEVENGLASEYAKLTAAHPELSAPAAPKPGAPAGPSAVAGEGARFLNQLRDHAAAVAKGKPSHAECMQVIVEAWIAQSAGELKSRGGGDIYVDGRFLVSMKFYRDGGSYKVVEKPKGKLQTPRADHVIDSLKPVFASGKTINDLNVEKVATITVEDEIDWGFNDTYEIVIRYRTKDKIESIQTIGHPVSEERTHENAPQVERDVMSRVNLDQLAELTELKAAPEGR
jgi:hypothetical protein